MESLSLESLPLTPFHTAATMSNFTFLSTNSTAPQTKNPNHHHQTSYSTACMMDGYDRDDHHDHQDFDLSSYLALLDDQLHQEDDHHVVSKFDSTASFLQSGVLQEKSNGSSSNSINNVTRNDQMQVLNECARTKFWKSRSGLKRAKMEVGCKIAFRTKSDLEIMDDGFKWRKYGKKMVKNNPNPRNYYKCSSEGCNVKKRVERDREDESYVITTYEGIHNHESPSVIYCNEMPLTFPSNGWTLQASSSSS